MPSHPLPPPLQSMSYVPEIRYLEQLLNGCGGLARFTPTGRKLLRSPPLWMAVKVLKVDVLRTNDCFPLPSTPTTARACAWWTSFTFHLPYPKSMPPGIAAANPSAVRTHW